MPLLFSSFRPQRGGIAFFNGFNQRLAMPPIIKPNIDFVTLLGATTPYRGTKRGQSSAGGEGQGPELGWIV